MTTINTENLPDPQEVVDKGFERYDNYRAENLKNLVSARQVQTNQLDREYSRLVQKYGEDHPLTVQTETKIEFNRLHEAEIQKEIVRVETPAPTTEKKKWTIYGYVLSADGKAVGGVLVFLFDEKKQKVGAVEPIKTNENGYFILETEDIKKLPDAVYAGVSPREINPQSLKPEAGKTDYVEIVLVRKGSPPTEVPPVPTAKGWTITGRILDAKGEGLPGLIVKVYDKDVFDDDFLGETRTNERGIYSVSFPKEKFSDIFENYPEVFLVVENNNGERIYDGRSKTNYGAGHIELLDVQMEERNGSLENKRGTEK